MTPTSERLATASLEVTAKPCVLRSGSSLQGDPLSAPPPCPKGSFRKGFVEGGGHVVLGLGGLSVRGIGTGWGILVSHTERHKGIQLLLL